MQIQNLDAPQVCLLFASTTLGLLDTLKKRRVDVLGGWDKAVIGQGVIKKTDPAVEYIEDMEERFFAVTNDLEKICGKLSISVMQRNGKKPATLIDDNSRNYIHHIAARMIDELQHFVDTAANGYEPGVTYLDGYNDALDEVEHLMFKHNLSRQKAIDTMRSAHQRREELEAA
jgi:hypothetical protein